MKKRILTLVTAAVLTATAAQTSAQTVAPAPTDWFEEARFGMFVHFGPYAVLGNGEWIMNARNIDRKSYMRLQDIFNPASFNAAEWVATAKRAGMKYIVVTSRHHDGFSNWATEQSDWNIMNTPYGKDLLKQLADECRAQGMKLGFYYSLLDWNREDYQWETGRRSVAYGRTGPSNWESYIAFMKAQLTELLTNYGDIAVIWFDGHWDQTKNKTENDPNTIVDWHYPEIYGLIRRLQPNCLIANNHHTTPFQGESYQIFERDVPGENTAGYSTQAVSRLPLETCQTISGSWGFSFTDNNYKSPTELIRLLARTAGMGGNLLLNVGPMPDGRITPESVERLDAMGQWLGKWGHTIYGTGAGFIKPQDWGSVTRKGNKYYVHIFNAPAEGALALNIPGFVSAKWLNVAGTPRYSYDKRTGYVTLALTGGGSTVALDPVDSILEVTVK